MSLNKRNGKNVSREDPSWRSLLESDNDFFSEVTCWKQCTKGKIVEDSYRLVLNGNERYHLCFGCSLYLSNVVRLYLKGFTATPKQRMLLETGARMSKSLEKVDLSFNEALSFSYQKELAKLAATLVSLEIQISGSFQYMGQRRTTQTIEHYHKFNRAATLSFFKVLMSKEKNRYSHFNYFIQVSNLDIVTSKLYCYHQELSLREGKRLKNLMTIVKEVCHEVLLEQQREIVKEFNRNCIRLHKFLEVYEPYRIVEATQLITNYMRRYGVKAVNKKLRKKYDVDLDTYKSVPHMNKHINDDEFNVKLLMFLTKHEEPENIERAIHATKIYKRRNGISALNTKLYMKYGESLNDIEDVPTPDIF